MQHRQLSPLLITAIVRYAILPVLSLRAEHGIDQHEVARAGNLWMSKRRAVLRGQCKIRRRNASESEQLVRRSGWANRSLIDVCQAAVGGSDLSRIAVNLGCHLCASVCNSCRYPTARLACEAAVKIARLSCFSTSSQWPR